MNYFCKDCKYYVPEEPKRLAGECHRYPPTVQWDAESVETNFPEVVGETDWCGEFERAKTKSPVVGT